MKLVTVFTLGVALALTAGAAQAQGQGGQGGGRPGFGGRGPGGGGFFGGPGGGGLGMLLQIPEVQTELKIDATQKELLDQLNMENRDKMRALFQQGGFGRPGGQGGAPDPAARAEFGKKMAAMQAEQSKAIGEVLDAKQMARLKQLGVQREGTRALGRPEVQDQLKLSADQRQKVTAAFDGERQAMQAMFESFRPQEGQPPSEEQRAEFGKKMQAARTTAEANALAVLSEGQKTQFKALQGAPFKFPEGGPGGFGGFGGRGGRPGGQRQNN
jgi:hypothetical protein